MKRRRRATGALFLLLVSVWAVWYNQHRTIGWGQTFNPFYWLRRYRGEDLYDPDTALLLHGNRALPEVALTFDDGPHTESRAQILDILRQNGVHATFFDVGMRMAESPDLLLRTLAEGHEVANHSYNHNRLDSLEARDRHREINDVDIACYRITGRHLTLLRPPGMRYNAEVLAMTHQLGYVVVGYTTLSGDYEVEQPPAQIASRILRRVENGSILLLHDYAPTAAALPEILSALRQRGFRCVTVSEMLAHLPERQRQQVLAFQRAQSAVTPSLNAASIGK